GQGGGFSWEFRDGVTGGQASLRVTTLLQRATVPRQGTRRGTNRSQHSTGSKQIHTISSDDVIFITRGGLPVACPPWTGLRTWASGHCWRSRTSAARACRSPGAPPTSGPAVDRTVRSAAVAITAVAVAVTRRAPRVTRLARPRPRVGVAAAYLAGTGHEQRDRAALEPAATSRRVTGLGRSAAPGALVRNLAGPRGRTVSMVT